MDVSRLRTRLALVVLCGAAVLLGLGLSRPAPIAAVDQEQPRLDRAAPVPSGADRVVQTFTAAHNGLSSVELLAVVYGDNAVGSTLTLRLLNEAGEVLAAAPHSGFGHNAPLRLAFAPLRESQGQTYTLDIEGLPEGNATVWAYDLDGYPGGALRGGGAPAAGDLRFTTHYTYLWADAARDSLAQLLRLILWLPILWVILFAPGLLLTGLLPAGALPWPWARWGLGLGLSLAGLPMLWLWSTAAGWRWTAPALGVVYSVIGLVVFFRGALRGRARTGWRRLAGEGALHHLAMAAILLAGTLARLLAVRDHALPQWVDSPHHFTIARVLAEAGQVPQGYRPLLPVDSFDYHFGFHALAVTFHWLSGLSLVEVFLFLGQVLNGLAPLAIYPFVAALTGRPRAALLAAFFTGLVSLFPGYYVSWGRYTQLAGVLILAPACGLVWAAAAGDEEGRAGWRRLSLLIGLLAAGLALTHYRVFAFWLIFVLAALTAMRGGLRPVMLGGLAGALLSLPWLAHLLLNRALPTLEAAGGLTSPEGYNLFPWDYFRSPLERGWLVLAAAFLLWGLLRRMKPLWAAGGWVAAMFVLLNIGPGTWLINNNAWAITLFVPGALALGWGMDAWLSRALEWIRPAGAERPERSHAVAHSKDAPSGLQHPERSHGVAQSKGAAPLRWLLGWAMLLMACGLMAWAGPRGLFAQVSVANPTTMLAAPADVEALDWVARHTPGEAVFLVNGWLWQAGIWAGSDAGYWLWPLAGRQTTLPPLDYVNQPGLRQEVAAFNESLARQASFGTAEALGLLRGAGVTHVFIGARGGQLKPEAFARDPNYELVFSNGLAWVFRLRD